MYKRILIAVDDSGTSNAALEEAIKLSKLQKAKLRIVHVADEQFVDYVGLGVDYEQYANSVRKYGQQILRKTRAIARQSKVDFDSQLIELTFDGRVEEKIVEAAQAWSADLLVIGTHGRRGFNHFLLGSVAEGITRIAPIPVLLIRGKPL